MVLPWSNHLYDEGDSCHEDFDIGSNERGIPCYCMALGGGGGGGGGEGSVGKIK